MNMSETLNEAWKLFCPRAGTLSSLMTSHETELEMDLAWLDKKGDDPEDPSAAVLTLDKGDILVRGGLGLPLSIWVGIAILVLRERGERAGLLYRGERILVVLTDPGRPLPLHVGPKTHLCPSCPWRAECELFFREPGEFHLSQGGVKFGSRTDPRLEGA